MHTSYKNVLLLHWIKKNSDIVDNKIGFFQQVASGEEIFINLVVDEMCIMKHLQFDGKKFVGNVDLGEEEEKENTGLAGESLTFMAVALNSNCKVPLGYFFIKSLSATGTSFALEKNTCKTLSAPRFLQSLPIKIKFK